MNGIKPLDIVVLVALRHASDAERARPTAWLAERLEMSTKSSHDSLKRLVQLRLALPDHSIVARSFVEFVEDAAPYVFPASPGPVAGGVPTATSTLPLSDVFAPADGELAFVWADADGSMRGAQIEPLHRSVPSVARSSPEFHADMALIDALRLQEPRIRREARRLLRERFLEKGS